MDCVIKTTKGTIEGIKQNGYVVFKGIPYAKAPVGELRWKVPVEMDPWDEIYKADTYVHAGATTGGASIHRKIP